MEPMKRRNEWLTAEWYVVTSCGIDRASIHHRQEHSTDRHPTMIEYLQISKSDFMTIMDIQHTAHVIDNGKCIQKLCLCISWRLGDLTCTIANPDTLVNGYMNPFWNPYHNHNKTKHNKTMWIFYGIYIVSTLYRRWRWWDSLDLLWKM